ncbi:MAG: ABC transporter permease [Sneathiella sp.]|jgi:peptide/nickel transport system permease protein|uniref:ABC transporter permease n=1 Tax=Sneathiella sp. TaxID=1964365 RepID=UPI000C64DC89|nr:ABC transporter permease [Sneathiella sp.]MAL79963.1 ABC transporter permease [Sneathiella sp.]|tara:strand:- start:38 stop:970 length:933 start_codon:yes stop_codon:yes gene_type:complete
MQTAKLSKWWAGFYDHDVTWSFLHSPLTMLASLVTLLLVGAAFGAPYLTSYTPFEPGSLSLMDAFLPPAWEAGGSAAHFLGTDGQGRDVLAAIMYGTQISLIVGLFSVLLSVAIGIPLGIIAGYATGSWIDTLIMRVADIQLTIPPILIALMIDGVVRTSMSNELHEEMAIPVLIFSIGIASWPQYARITRSGAMVERRKDYIAAAKLIQTPAWLILLRHIFPNVVGPTLIVATIGVAVAIIIEATLSFLGVGVPPTNPSLGTLIRIGNNFLFSGEWWITFFPAFTLVILVLSVNLIGDWLRDTFNPKLR